MSQEGSPVQDFTSYNVVIRTCAGAQLDQIFTDLKTAKSTCTMLWVGDCIESFRIYEIPGQRGCENVPIYSEGHLSRAKHEARASAISARMDVKIDDFIREVRKANQSDARQLVKAFLNEQR